MRFRHATRPRSLACLVGLCLFALLIAPPSRATAPDVLWSRTASATYNRSYDPFVVVFSADRSRVAVAENIYEWDAETGRLVFLRKLPFRLSDSSTVVYRFSPDGLNFVLASDGGGVTTYRISDGEKIGWFAAHPPEDVRKGYWSVPTLSPDVRYVVYKQDVWSVNEGRFLYRLPEYTGFVNFSPDSGILAVVGADYKARLLRASDGQEVASFDVSPPDGQSSGAYQVTFSEDGAYLFAHQPGRIEARRVADPSLAVFTLPVAADAREVRVSPDWQTLATVGYNSAIHIWRGGIGGWSPDPDDLPDSALNSALSPDLATYASLSDGAVRVRRVSDRHLLRSFPPGSVIGFSRDAATLLLASDVDTTDPRPIYQYTPWRVSDGQPVDGETGHPISITALAYSPDGSILASGGPGVLHFWRASDGAALRTLTGPRSPVTGIAFSPDGKTVHARSDRDAFTWDVRTGALLDSVSAPPDLQGNTLLSPDGEVTALSSHSESIFLLRNRDGQSLPPIGGASGESLSPLAFTPDSRGLLISRDRQIGEHWTAAYEVRSVENGQTLRTVARADQNLRGVESDGRTLALVTDVTPPSGSPEYAVSVYDVQTGDLVRTSPITAGPSPFLLVDPAVDLLVVRDETDGALKLGGLRESDPPASYSYDGTPPVGAFASPRRDVLLGVTYTSGQTAPYSLILWNAGRPEPVLRYDDGVSGIRDVAFSPDGRTFAYLRGKVCLTVAAYPGVPPLPGDVDGSGAVDIDDAVLALRSVVGQVSLTALQARAADLYPDGRVTVQDVVLILSKALGLPG